MGIIETFGATSRAVLLSVAITAGGAGAPAADPGEQAFPGAVGYGAGAVGWRGGAVIAVTSLAGRGPGSLRACAEQDMPRICVFRVAGTITLDAPIMARSNLYIAGQTAPGGGIQLRLGQSTHGPLIIKNAHDVVVRFLKIRPGPGGGPSATIDAVTVENAQRVYLGNLSLMFATDETVNVHVSGGVASDITLADSILAYSLDRANHPKGRHSKGALICSDEGADVQCGRISLLRNVFAHHRDRNPDLKATALGPVEVINNIFYDPISQFGEFYDLLGDTRIAYLGNLALTGPSSVAQIPAAVELFEWHDTHAIRLRAEGNLAYRQPGCSARVPLPVVAGDMEAEEAPGPTIPATLHPEPAARLEVTLPARAGDVLPGGGHRDRLDRRVLTDLARCEGRVIDAVAQVDGWPDIAAAAPPRDRDGDLLPDGWERTQPGLDPQRADDPWGQKTGPASGSAPVEIWLAKLAGDR
jgi:pectate lyase